MAMQEKHKSIFYYLFVSIFLLGMLLLYIKSPALINDNNGYKIFKLIYYLFPFSVGILMGIPYMEKISANHNHLNVFKLLIVGLPTLLLWLYIPLHGMFNITPLIDYQILQIICPVAGTLMGHTLITSIKR